jgi:hypothetical protein
VIANCDIDTKQRRFPKADVLASMFSLVENTGASLEEVIARVTIISTTDGKDRTRPHRLHREKSWRRTRWISTTCW